MGPLSDTTDTQSEPTALASDTLRESIVESLRAALGDELLEVHLVPNDDLWVRVSAEAWRQAGQALRDQGFDYFCFLSAIDWLPSPFGRGEDDPSAEPDEAEDDGPAEMTQGYAGGSSRFQMLARVSDLRRHVGVTVKADVNDSMVVESWIPVYAGANWHERETHEMFGIGFAGHPDLRNMYLPGDFEGYPLRKDFPLLSRMVKPWPGIVDVEPMPAEDEDEEAEKP